MKLIKDNKYIEIEMCDKIFKRFKGFMLKKKVDKCLCFDKCNAIHTFFMFKSIDVIMTDKNFNILYIFYNLKPNRIILPKKNVYYTFELPINKFKFKINEKIKVK